MVAVASSCSRMLVSRASSVPVAIDSVEQGRKNVQMATAARSCLLQRPYYDPRLQSFGSNVHSVSQRTFSNSSKRVVVRAAAPVTSFEQNVPGSLVPNHRNIQTEPEIDKDKGNEADEMKQWIEEIRAMFQSMTDGEITSSPYDTAWVALVPALDGSDGPQFPKSLEWIIENQIADGSWGDRAYFSYYDRVCNTLACIIALKTWKTGSVAVEKGVRFIQKNLQEMEKEVDAYMMIGFEIVFPTLISYAEGLELNLPFDAPIISKFSAEREKKLAKIGGNISSVPYVNLTHEFRIPMDIMHKVPTTLLHSLEGFHEELDWEKLLKLQSEDGSFLCSPASTAACLLHTKDEKALGYLNRLLDRFNNAVPNVYPVDLFERIWTVDRLLRLGIDRYFEKEIKDSLDYVYKYFTSSGIGWARGSAVQDLDDTAMGFRLLRLHGYDVNEDVFRQFTAKDSEFVCFAGQSGQAVTGMLNFYRATQTRFPGETLLKTGEHFARGFLVERHEKNECFDKWIITKDLPGEVEYALTTPWYYSMPIIETETYLSHYGTNDIWIGKSLYRMPYVNNETFLALAKANFNLCQAKYQEELKNVTSWVDHCGFGKLTFARQTCIEVLFSAACVLPSPEFSPARLVWTRTCVLATVLDDYFDVGGNLADMRKLVAAFKEWNPSLMDGTAEEARVVFNGLYNTLSAMTKEGTIRQGRDIGQHLQTIWLRWLESCLTEAEWTTSSVMPSYDEYMTNALPSIALELIMLSTVFFLGEAISDEFFNDPQKLRLVELTNHVGRLLNDIQGWKRESSQNKANAVSILLRDNPTWREDEAISDIRAKVEGSMLELVRDVHQPSHIPKSIRQLHFETARNMFLFYQTRDGYTDSSAMAEMVKKILFQPVT